MFGKDIYWYGVQAISLLESGKLHSPDRSPVFHIVSFLFRLFGVNEESLWMFQILTVLWLIFSLLGARYLLTTQLNEWNVLPNVIVFVLGFLYPKQAWAIGFLLFSFAFLFSTRIHKKIWRLCVSGFFLILATWFHTMVGVFGIGLVCLFLVPKKFYLPIFLCFVIIPHYFLGDINNRLVFDIKSFPLKAAFGMVGFGILWDWYHLIFGNTSTKKYQTIRNSIAFMGLLLVLPIFHFADIQFRILLSILVVVGIFSLNHPRHYFITALSFVFWIGTLIQSPDLFRYPYEEMWNPGERAASIPNNGLLIAHHGFCEYYHFQFRKDCLSWVPDEKAMAELPSGSTIYRLVYGIRRENLNASSENGKPIFSFIQPLGEYQLVLETDWNRYLIWLEGRNSKLLPIAKSWKNPYRKRPDFLQRKQNYGI